MSKVVYKASCWDCQDSYIGKTKRRLHDRKLNILRGSQVPVMHLLLQATSRQLVTTSNGTTLRYWQKVGLIPIVIKIKETLLIQELKPTLNDNVSSEKLYLY